MTKRTTQFHTDQHNLYKIGTQQPDQLDNHINHRQVRVRRSGKLATAEMNKDSNCNKNTADSDNRINKRNKAKLKKYFLKCQQDNSQIQANFKNQSVQIFWNSKGLGLFKDNDNIKIVNQSEKQKIRKEQNTELQSSNQGEKKNSVLYPNISMKKEKLFFENKSQGLFEKYQTSLLTKNSLFNGKSLFNNESLFSKTSLFNNSKLFSGVNTTSSIFGFNENESLFPKLFNTNDLKHLQIQRNNETEEEGDSAQLQKGQNMDISPNKSNVKYEYSNNCKVIQSVKVNKYKKDNGDLIQKVIVTILLDLEKSIYYFVVKLAVTQNAIFNGFLIPNKSKIKQINNKAQHFEIVVFNIQVENHKKKLKNHRIKIVISSEEANKAKTFYQKLTQIIEGKSETDE